MVDRASDAGHALRMPGLAHGGTVYGMGMASVEDVDRATIRGGVVALIAAYPLRGAVLASGPDREGVARERYAIAEAVADASVGRLEVSARAREAPGIHRILSLTRALSRNQT